MEDLEAPSLEGAFALIDKTFGIEKILADEGKYLVEPYYKQSQYGYEKVHSEDASMHVALLEGDTAEHIGRQRKQADKEVGGRRRAESFRQARPRLPDRFSAVGHRCPEGGREGDRRGAAARRLPLGLHRDPAVDPLLPARLDHGPERLRRPRPAPLPRQPAPAARDDHRQ